MEALGIGGEVEEFGFGSGGGEPLGGEGGEFAFALEFAEQGHAGVLVFLVAGPDEARLLRMEVADEPTIWSDDGADAVHGIATAIAGGEDFVAGGEVAGEDGLALHPVGDGQSGEF